MAVDPNNAADPLQPGSPFKKGNFNKFAFGMMLLMVLFIAAVLFDFWSGHKRVPHTATPSNHSRLCLPQGPWSLA